MKEILVKFIESIRLNTKINTYDEASTKQAIILPIIQILGWNVFDVDEVTPEYTVENKRVDYSLRVNNTNEFFIEVKKPTKDLEKHQDQLLDYSFRQGVELAALTNGITWWLYLPTQKGSWHERKFYTIDLYQQDSEDISNIFVNLLSKQNIVNGDAVKNALMIYRGRRKSKIINSTIPEAWNKIILEPDSLLIDLILEVVEKLCGYKPEPEKVIEFLKSNTNQLTVFPTIDIEKPKEIKPKDIDKSKPSNLCSPSTKVSQDELIPYIVALLFQFGGKATKMQVDEEIYKIFKEQFSDSWYHELVSHGVERWKHNIAWAKERAVQYHNLIKPASKSGRGIWELTEKGKEYYHQIKSKIEIKGG